jgi:hypothetical protein
VVQSREKSVNVRGTEKDLNSKILQITMIIKDRFPELPKYLDEMPVTIPNDNNPEITLKNLSQYYESLNSLMNNYLLAHPQYSKTQN